MLNPDRAIFLSAAFFLAAACTSTPESAQPVLNDPDTTLFQFDPTLYGADLEARADIGTRAHKPSEWPVTEGVIAVVATGLGLGLSIKVALGENEKRKASTDEAPAQPATTSASTDPRDIVWTPTILTGRNRIIAAATADAQKKNLPLYKAAPAFFSANMEDVLRGETPVSPLPSRTRTPQQGGSKQPPAKNA